MSTVGFVVAQTRRVPVFFWGHPGIGKTQIVQQFGKFLGLPVIEPSILVSDPSEVAGIPYRSERGFTEKLPPKWAIDAERAGKCIIFIDEITNLRRELQAIALGIVQERKIGDRRLNPDVIVMAAGNPMETSTDWHGIQPALANRMCHIDFEVPRQTWIQKFRTGEFGSLTFPKLPPNWEDIAKTKYFPLLGSFLERCPNYIDWIEHQKELDYEKLSRGWPSRRSWELASYSMAACEAASLSNDDIIKAMIGCVGVEAAMDYQNWYNTLDLPSPEEVLQELRNNKKYWKSSFRSDHVLVLMPSLLTLVSERKDHESLMLTESFMLSAMKAGFSDIAALNCPRFFKIAESVEGFKPSLEFLQKTQAFVSKALQFKEGRR